MSELLNRLQEQIRQGGAGQFPSPGGLSGRPSIGPPPNPGGFVMQGLHNPGFGASDDLSGGFGIPPGGFGIQQGGGRNLGPFELQGAAGGPTGQFGIPSDLLSRLEQARALLGRLGVRTPQGYAATLPGRFGAGGGQGAVRSGFAFPGI